MVIRAITAFLVFQQSFVLSTQRFWYFYEFQCDQDSTSADLTTEHITRIDFTKGPRGNIFRFQVYANGVAQRPAPQNRNGCGCESDLYFDSLQLTGNQRIIKLDVGSAIATNGVNDILKLVFYLNDDSVRTFDSRIGSESLQLVQLQTETYELPLGFQDQYEFTGFEVGSSSLGYECYTTFFSVSERNVCLYDDKMTIDMSSFDMKTKKNTDPPLTKSIIVTDLSNGQCGALSYQLQYAQIGGVGGGNCQPYVDEIVFDPNQLTVTFFQSPPAFECSYLIQLFWDFGSTDSFFYRKKEAYFTFLEVAKQECLAASFTFNQNLLPAEYSSPHTFVLPELKVPEVGVGCDHQLTFSTIYNGVPIFCGVNHFEENISVTPAPSPSLVAELYSYGMIRLKTLSESDAILYTGQYQFCLSFFPTNCFVGQLSFAFALYVPNPDNKVDPVLCDDDGCQRLSYSQPFDISKPWRKKIYLEQDQHLFSKQVTFVATSQSNEAGSVPEQVQFEQLTTGEKVLDPARSIKQTGIYTFTLTNVVYNNRRRLETELDMFPIDPGSPSAPISLKIFVTDLYSCLSTSVESVAPSSISIEVSDEEKYFAFESFKDSASTAYGDSNFCKKSYQVSISTNENGEAITSVRIDAANNQLIFASKKLRQIGTYLVTLTALITEYPNRNASTQFSLVVRDPCLQNYSPTASISLQGLPKLRKVNYQVYNPVIKIGYQSIFELSLNSESASKCLRAYIYEGVKLPSSLDLSCSCLSDDNNYKWIDLDYDSGQILIFTADNSDSRDYEVFVVQFVPNNADVLPLVRFSVTINPFSSFSDRQPPHFVHALESVTVLQCPNSTSELWHFLLPQIVDPQNSEVKVFLLMDNNILKYDDLKQTISQIKIAQSPITYTIQVTLMNGFNLKSVYSMQVQFVCVEPHFKVAFEFNLKQQQEKLSHQIYQPSARIVSIDQYGLMLVKFGQTMIIPSNPKILETDYAVIDGILYPLLEIKVLPGQNSDIKLLSFEWQLVEFQATQLQIQLDFENKNQVSSHSLHCDQIQVIVHGFQLFQDSRGNLMAPQKILNPRNLPRLISADTNQLVQALIITVQVMFYSSIGGDYATQLFLSGTLQQLLNSLRQLQLTVHVMLINVAFPAITTQVMRVFMNLLNFQLYDFSAIYNRILFLDPDARGNNPFNDQFSLMGYGSLYIVQNFGMMCWTILVGPFMCMIFYLLSRLSPRIFEAQKIKWHQSMRYNYWIVLINQTFMFLAVCCSLNLFFYFKFDSFGNSINTLLAIFLGATLVWYAIFVAVWFNLPKNFAQILNREESFLARFGAAVDAGLNFKRRGKKVLVYQTLSILRKLWLTYVVVFLQERPVLGIFQVNFQALLMIAVLGYTEPQIGVGARRLEMANEMFILLTTYHLYQFTDFLSDLDTRDLVGLSLVYITFLNLGLNFGFISFQNAFQAYRKFKLRYLAWKKQQRAKRIRKYPNLNEQRRLEFRQTFHAELEARQRNYKMKDKEFPTEMSLKESFDFFKILVQEEQASDKQSQPEPQLLIPVKVKPFKTSLIVRKTVVPLFELSDPFENGAEESTPELQFADKSFPKMTQARKEQMTLNQQKPDFEDENPQLRQKIDSFDQDVQHLNTEENTLNHIIASLPQMESLQVQDLGDSQAQDRPRLFSKKAFNPITNDLNQNTNSQSRTLTAKKSPQLRASIGSILLQQRKKVINDNLKQLQKRYKKFTSQRHEGLRTRTDKEKKSKFSDLEWQLDQARVRHKKIKLLSRPKVLWPRNQEQLTQATQKAQVLEPKIEFLNFPFNPRTAFQLDSSSQTPQLPETSNIKRYV